MVKEKPTTTDMTRTSLKRQVSPCVVPEYDDDEEPRKRRRSSLSEVGPSPCEQRVVHFSDKEPEEIPDRSIGTMTEEEIKNLPSILWYSKKEYHAFLEDRSRALRAWKTVIGAIIAESGVQGSEQWQLGGGKEEREAFVTNRGLECLLSLGAMADLKAYRVLHKQAVLREQAHQRAEGCEFPDSSRIQNQVQHMSNWALKEAHRRAMRDDTQIEENIVKSYLNSSHAIYKHERNLAKQLGAQSSQPSGDPCFRQAGSTHRQASLNGLDLLQIACERREGQVADFGSNQAASPTPLPRTSGSGSSCVPRTAHRAVPISPSPPPPGMSPTSYRLSSSNLRPARFVVASPLSAHCCLSDSPRPYVSRSHFSSSSSLPVHHHHHLPSMTISQRRQVMSWPKTFLVNGNGTSTVSLGFRGSSPSLGLDFSQQRMSTMSTPTGMSESIHPTRRPDHFPKPILSP